MGIGERELRHKYDEYHDGDEYVSVDVTFTFFR